jgi:hypothetical protein
MDRKTPLDYLHLIGYYRKTLEPRLSCRILFSDNVPKTIDVMVRPRVYRGVTWRTFHFSYTFHLYVLFILFHTLFCIQTPPTCLFHSTMSMLPFYSVHTQVYKTCFAYLLFHLYLFQTFQYLNHSSRVVSSLVYTL